MTISSAATFSVPLLIDWLLQRLSILPSTNIRRFATGLACGFAVTPHGVTI
jgi:hypothetical protein